MKKTKLFLAALMMSAISLVSCGSEETTVEQSTPTVQFAKTTEMLNFESSLKVWMQSKRENNAKQLAQVSQETEKKAKELLISIGKNEIANRTSQSSDEIIRTAMKEYSKKLTEMYNENK